MKATCFNTTTFYEIDKIDKKCHYGNVSGEASPPI